MQEFITQGSSFRYTYTWSFRLYLCSGEKDKRKAPRFTHLSFEIKHFVLFQKVEMFEANVSIY